MSIAVVCGTNWGDEGKGRMVDYLARDAHAVVRYQGGNNAGHTVVNEYGTFALHLIPSGIFYTDVACVLGPGTVIDLEALHTEIESLTAAGISCDNIRISDRATILFPFYRDEDAWEEERLGAKAYGSTKTGIAPAYGDRHVKKALRIGELLYPKQFKEQLQHIVEWKNLVASGVFQQKHGVSYQAMVDWAFTFGEKLKDRICDTTELLESMAAAGKHILFEAQLGALRDIYYGIYPYTTSSCSLASFAPVGGGLFKHRIDRVVGVMKAFSTCVGEGPFVAAMTEDEAQSLRETALEYGATTGRPRRIGHFDAVASHFGAAVQGATEIALTKLDSLSGHRRLKICTHYAYNGKRTNRFPLNPILNIAEPVYTECEGWTEDITDCRQFETLPTAAQQYVLRIEELIDCHIRYISVGPERAQLIDRGAL
jgi:adenylosuccinate synthase